MLILKLFGVGGAVPLKRNWVIQLELGTYFLEEVGRARFNLATPTYATVEYSPCSVRKLLGGGGRHSPEKVVRVRPAVKTPFSRLSCHSLDPQLQHDSVL